MQDISSSIEYRGNVYKIVFNLNVMERIQDEYETVDAWADLMDSGNAKAVIFGFAEMINEGLDIEAEENGTEYTPLSHKQVGRIITEYGIVNASKIIQKTVVDSTESAEKNE